MHLPLWCRGCLCALRYWSRGVCEQPGDSQFKPEEECPSSFVVAVLMCRLAVRGRGGVFLKATHPCAAHIPRPLNQHLSFLACLRALWLSNFALHACGGACVCCCVRAQRLPQVPPHDPQRTHISLSLAVSHARLSSGSCLCVCALGFGAGPTPPRQTQTISPTHTLTHDTPNTLTW